ncbi:hypothetical protein ACFLZ8_00165 [Planctomycetota bacterium]
MNPEEKIQKLISKSQVSTDAGTDRKILNDAMEHLDKIKLQKDSVANPYIGRIIMKNPQIKIATAAILIVVVLVSLPFLLGRKSPWQTSTESSEIQVAEVDIPQITLGPEQIAEPIIEEPTEEVIEVTIEEPLEVAADTSDLVPIDIELPKPLFIGTPQDAVVENLEKPLGTARPPFLAPAGTTNVASGKPVESSDSFIIIGEPEYVTDGNKEATDGNYVQLATGVQNVTIDLGAIHEIYAIVVWHLHRQPVVFFDVIVQTSNDEFFIENVQTLFNNDIDNSAGLGIGKDMHFTETNEGKLIDAKGVQGRYVRLYSNGYNLEQFNYYTEVEVYGKPVD